MSTKFLFKSLSILNYRCIKNLDISKFRRVNLIGGYNSVGKSTLLEAIFSIVDLYNPLFVVRSAMVRNVHLDIDDAISRIFYNMDMKNEVIIKSSMNIGSVKVRMKYEIQPALKSFSSNINNVSDVQNKTSTSNQMGLTVSFLVDNKILDIFRHVSAGQQVNVRSDNGSISPFPRGVLYNKNTISFMPEIASQFSYAIQNKMKKRLIDYVKILEKDIVDLEIITIGGQSHVAGVFSDERYIPLGFLGSGASSLVSICLAIMTAANGVVLLDEFDTAVHYSKLMEIWKIIGELAREFNCQIFAATHSSECIKAAAQAFGGPVTPNDFMYYRIDTSIDKTIAVQYDSSEVLDSLYSELEVR